MWGATKRHCTMSLAAVLCLVLAVSLVDSADDRIVSTDQGPVRGYLEDGVYSYYSIPYATAPTGADRFKAALPPPTWTEVFNATQMFVVCPQSGLPVGIITQEQCLVTSVFTPNTTTENLPVVVYVHGGAFHTGFGNLFTPKHLVESQNVVAVTLNYRLGAHGFLCLGTEAAPGNSGIKDQIALLKWVQRNIANFGGNPNDVTIAGYSAGSASVDLIMLSKSAQGLFNKVIPESGANVQAFSVQTNPIENAKWFARQLNFTNVDNIKELENFYLNTPLEVLTRLDNMSRTDGTATFSPCIEKDLGQERFLEDSPLNILRSGNYTKYPILYGIAEMEGLISIGQFEEYKDLMNKNFADFLPHDLRFDSEAERNSVAEKIKSFYFGNEQVGNHNVLKYVEYFTDCLFGYGKLRSAKLQAQAGNNQLYLYKYSFVDEDVPFIPHTNVRGADHCAQSYAVLDSSDENLITEEYKEMKRIMREIWGNFIITGEPIPSNSMFPAWRPITADNLSYMSLNNTLVYRDRMMYERMVFWEEIYDKYYQQPVPPNPDNSTNNSSVRINAPYIFSTLSLLCFLILSS